MNILAIDTSTSLLGIGLQTDSSYFEIDTNVGLHHTENLLVEIKKICTKADLSCADLQLIVVAKGPGSFTGLRIGMAAVKGIAFGASIPMVSIPNIDTYGWARRWFHGTVCPVIDARKQRVYTAFYSRGERITEYLDITPQELQRQCENYPQVLLTGPYGPEMMDICRMKSPSIQVDPDFGRPLTWALMQYGTELFKTRGADNPSEGPLYIRMSEAEASLKEKQKE